MAAISKQKKLTSHKLIQFSCQNVPALADSSHVLKSYIYGQCKLSIASPSNQVVYVLSGSSIVVTIHSPYGVLDACISAGKSPQPFLLIIGLSGTIFRISLSPFLKSNGATRTHHLSDDSDSIFDDLLKNEASADAASITLMKSDIFLLAPGVVRLLSFGHYVITVRQTWGGHTIHMNSWTEEGASLREIATYSVDSSPTQAPVSKAPPILHCVYPEGLAGSVTVCSTSQHSALQKHLYARFFGEECGLLEVPVLLIGCSSGNVYTMPLHSGTNAQPQLLCDLQQTVTGIFGLSIQPHNAGGGGDKGQNTSGTAATNMLLLLGSCGKVLTLSVEQNSTSGRTTIPTATTMSRDGGFSRALSTYELYVKGSVSCSVVLGSTLVHCAGYQLLVTDMKQAHNQEVYSHLTSEAFSGGRVSSMVSHGENSEWLSLTMRGHLYRHVLSEAGVTTAGDLTTTLSNHESLKDLLTGISRSSVQHAQVQQRVTRLDAAISQLTICGYIQATHTQTDQRAVPLSCSVCVDKRMGSAVMVDMRVRVVNQCAMTLSYGWSLVIRVSARDRAAATIVESGWGLLENICKVFPLVRLTQGDHQDVVVPLSTSQMDSLPLTVDIGLSFTMTSQPEVVTSVNMRTVVLPVLVTVIDIIHSLEASGSQCHVDLESGRTTLGTEWEFIRFAKNRPCWGSHPQLPISVSKETAENRSLKCFISERRGRNHVGDSEALSAEVELLSLLLADSGIIVPVDSTHVTARSVAGAHRVAMWVCRATMEEMSTTEEAEETLIVVLEAVDLGVLSQLHTAIANRLKRLPDYSEIQQAHIHAAKYEEMRRQALCLKDKTCGTNYSQHQAATDTMELFSTLRNITQ